MPDIVLSLIVPVRNVEHEIQDILQFAAQQYGDLATEIIIVDIGSADSTVLQSVQALHAADLRGCVIQNGDTTIAAALNTGLARAHGTYVSFLFARRLYQNFLPAYYQTALRTNADLVFGCFTEDAVKHAAKRLPGTGPSSNEYARRLLKREIAIDISALLLRTHFLTENHIQFAETCSYGYAEEFVLRCLLLANASVQAPALLCRDTAHELKRGKIAPCGRKIFQRVDAMLRILDVLHTSKAHSADMIALFQEQRLPEVIFSCIDVLLREGCSSRTVGLYLHRGGYDKMLVNGSATSPALRRKMLVWKTFSWLYRPDHVSP